MQEHSRSKWDTQSSFRLPIKPTNLMDAWSKFAGVLACFNAAECGISFVSAADYTTVYKTIPLSLPEEPKGVPILSWSSNSTLGILFPSLLLILQLEWSSASQNRVTLKRKSDFPLKRSMNSLHWVNSDLLAIWNNSQFMVLSLAKQSVVVSSEEAVSSISSFIDPSSEEPTLLVASTNLMRLIKLRTLRASKHLTDHTISSMAYNNSNTMYGIGISPNLLWPASEFIDISTEISPMASLLSVGASPAHSASSKPTISLIQFRSTTPSKMLQLDWEAPFSPPTSIDHLIFDTELNQLVFSKSASATVYLWKIAHPGAGLDHNARIAQLTLGSSKTRILGLTFSNSSTMEKSQPSSNGEPQETYLYALVGELTSDLSIAFLPSNRDYCNIELVKIKLVSHGDPELDMTPLKMPSAPQEPRLMDDLKTQLRRMAMEEVEMEDSFNQPLVPPKSTFSTESLLLQLTQQMQVMNSKIDSILSNQHALESRVEKLSEDFHSFVSTSKE